ncbi:MAG: Ig-like domain-containing protein [Anaerolineae bacterium]
MKYQGRATRNTQYAARITLVVILITLTLACQCPLSSILSRPTPTPTPPPEPLPPQVIQIAPARGEEQPLDAPLQLVFDQAMDTQTVEAAFTIEPSVSGTFEWPSERVMQFKPAGGGFERATRYSVTLKRGALSAKALPLDEPVQFHFTTVGFLEVAGVQPAEDTTEVATDATVTVLFNRPVVPLTAIEGQGNLPQPLTFEPPVSGTGEWLNTSIYLFTPDEDGGFAPATTYTAWVAAGLEDTTGGILAEDFTWEFTTIMPAVVGTYPDADTIYVSPEPTIHVAFNQPMDRASAEAAFELKDLSTGEAVAGTFEWHDEGLVLPRRETYEPYQWSWNRGEGPERVGVETMSFTPGQPLDFGTTYLAQVAGGAKGATGEAGTSYPYNWTFDTIAYPRIISTNPADGEQRADPWGNLEIEFSSPMDTESLNDNFTISPPVSATEVYTYWWDSNTQLEISFPIEPNSDYEVTISGDVRGRYGQELGQDTTIRWRTRAYDPMVYLHSVDHIVTFDAYTETLAYVTVRNVGRVNFALYRMPLEDFLRANGRNSWNYWNAYGGDAESLIRQWTLDVNPPLNQRAIYGTKLSEDGLLEPGLYFLKVQADPDSIYPEARFFVPEVSKQMLLVSRHNLSLKTTGTESLVWATDLRSGDVLPDLPVVVMDEHASVLAKGTTAWDGVFASDRHRPMDRWTPVFAFVGDADSPGPDFAAAISEWDDGITPWQFDLPVENYEDSFAGYLFTDRPIYRPGQTVYFKGIIREDDDAHYSLPTSDDKVHVEITDPEGKEVFADDLILSDMGTLDDEFGLDEEASLGVYTIRANYLVDKETHFYTTFQVAEYRKPEFQVEVETDLAEYTQGDEINVTAQASYFFGGPVADAQVRYVVLSADYFFDYQGQGWWDFTDYDYWRSGGGGPYGERIADGEGTTDAEGRFTFSLEADIAEKLTSQLFTLEVTVTDVNNQEVSNRTEAIVHKGTYYIGLQPERYVGTAGQANGVNLITVDWESDHVPGQEVTIVFAEHRWYSVQKQAEDGRYYWESTVEDVMVFTTTVTMDADGEASASFTPETGGIYKVIATGLDEKGNEVRSSTYMWISGREYINWRQENNDRIELVTDKRQYQVGDTATILIPHPYQGPVEALITVERGHIYDYRVQTLETNSEQIEMPITEDLIPNVFVSVVIVKGVDDNNPVPSFKVGYAQLSIETTEKELSITMTPDKSADEHYRPGETVTYDLSTSDSRGNPVEAEVALNLVDLAVLTLADRPGPDIVGYFWRERGLGVNTATGLTLSGNRLSEELGEEVKGLGGGGGGEEFGPVRRRFPDLAYWNPSLRTDEGGHAQISVELPDNLTTWRMGAHGVTAGTLVGEADVDIISTKDLLVRPVAPRFFVVGDEAELAAVVHNNTDEALEVEVLFNAQGLQVGESTSQRISVSANDKVKVVWPVTVEGVSETTLRFGARGGDYSDAVEITLPVYRYSTPEVVATAGTFDADGQVLEAVALPPSYDSTQGELAVHVDPSLAAGMTDGLDYLEHYPYECTEQTVSRFLPNVVTYRAFKELGLDRPDLEEKLPDLVSFGLQRLYNQQHYDGGWGWWVSDDSRPYLTAYVLLGLIEAQRAGFVVDEGVMKRAVEYLQGSLSRPRDLELHWQANRQAFILYVLAEAGEGDLARMETLFQKRDALDTFGKAYLVMAFGLLEREARVDSLLADISGDAIVSATGAHWEEAQVDYYAMNTDTRSTAIVLAALARLDPDNALAPNAVRWLMVIRKDGYWETTQETAWTILALTDWMVATGELEGAYNWHVVVNGEELGTGSVARENIDETVKLQVAVAELLADTANRVVIERWAPDGQEAGTGRLYYSLYLRYFKPVEEVTALNRGIIVSRRYTATGCDPEEETCPAISQAQVGDVIRVKLTIIAPHDLHYVVVEDPFPAGAEGIDQSLKTTSVAGEQPELVRTDRYDPWTGYGWWWFNHTELRDEKAVLFATYLPRGTYEYTYLIRASLPGEYRAIPTHAYEMYFPEVFGRSDGGVFTITE